MCAHLNIEEKSIFQELFGKLKPTTDHQLLLAVKKYHRSASKLFALLALVNKARFIIDFVDKDGLSDLDLPFSRSTDTLSALDIKLHPAGQETKIIEAMQNWSSRDIRQLNSVQWTVLAPFFDIDKLHINVTYPDNTIFPFEYDEVNDARNPSGAHGTVWKVRIHPAHHNFPNNSNNVRAH